MLRGAGGTELPTPSFYKSGNIRTLHHLKCEASVIPVATAACRGVTRLGPGKAKSDRLCRHLPLTACSVPQSCQAEGQPLRPAEETNEWAQPRCLGQGETASPEAWESEYQLILENDVKQPSCSREH